MATPRSRPRVIGIFGGNEVGADVLASARGAAEALIGQGVALLAGAVPPPNVMQVKGAVLEKLLASHTTNG